MTQPSTNTEVVIAADGGIAPTVIPEKGYDRRAYIGSSDVAGILGLSRYRTPIDTYKAKVGEPYPMEASDRLWLERRKRWEPVVVQMLREELEVEIINVNLRYGDGMTPYFAAEIDAEAREGDEIINIEIKTVDPRAYSSPRGGWGEPGTDDIPVEYEAQVQHGLGVTRRNRAVVAAMVGLDSMYFYPINRNDRVLPDMRERLARFWADHVLAKSPPDPRTLQDVAWLYPNHHEDVAMIADGELASKAMRLRAINAQIEALNLESEALEFDVKRAMGPAEAMFVDGRKIVTWRDKEWSRLDTTALKAKDPKAYRAFLLKGKRREFRTLKG